MESVFGIIWIVVVLAAIMAVTHSLRRIADAQEHAARHLASIDRTLANQTRSADTAV